jgi:hypothetical protein
MMCAVSGQRSGLSKSLIHMTSALVFLEGSASPQPLVNDLEACGVQVLAVLDAGSKLVQGVVRHAPDLVVGNVPQAGDALFETIQTLVNGCCAQRLRPLMQPAQALRANRPCSTISSSCLPNTGAACRC